MDPALLLFLVLCIWALRGAWDHVTHSYRADRDEKIAQAEGAAPPKGLSAAQRKRIAAHHAAGWWAREVLGGLPVARTGWQAGWLANKLAALHNRNARRAARALHDGLTGSQPSPLPHRQPPAAPPPPDQEPPEGGRVLPGPWPRPLRPVPDLPPDGAPPATAPPGQVPGPHVNGNGTPPPPQPQGDAVPTNTVPDSTYDQDQNELTKLAAKIEYAIQEIRFEQIQTMVEQAANVLNDAETVGKLADTADALREAKKQLQKALDETIDAKSTLRRNHGSQNEAHQNAPIPLGADPHYYQ